MAPPPRLELHVERDLGAVAAVAMAVHAHAAQVLDGDGAAAVELSLAEALTNAIKHGTTRGRATGRIRVTAEVTDAGLVVEVIDTVPVVPDGMLETAGAHRFEIDLDNLDSLAESGRGLSIIVLSMDEVTLRAADDQYALTMVKHLPGDPAPQPG